MRRALRRLVAKHLGPVELTAPDPIHGLLLDLDAMLDEADVDRRMLERSLDLVSRELIDRNRELHEALQGGQVGTWGLAAGAEELVLDGFPHPVVQYVRGRGVVSVAGFLAAIVPSDRKHVSDALGADAPDALDLRFWVEDSRGRRWIEMRGGTAGGSGHRVGVCLDITREAEAAERQEAIERHHHELVKLARTVAEGWGDLAAVYPVITEQVAATLTVDRVGVWLLDDTGTEMICVDRYHRSLDRHERGRRLDLETAPAYARAIGSQRVLAADDIEAHPQMQELLGWFASDLKSALQSSIFVRGELRGMVTLGHLGPTARAWTPEEHAFAASVADVVALALEGERRLRAEAALEEQRAFLRAVIDLDPNLIFAKDRAGRFTLVNQALADCYGTTVPELLGKTDADFNPNTEELAAFRRDDLLVIDELMDRFIPEERVTDARGQVRYLQTVKRPMLSADGVETQMLGVATDITARKLAEESRGRLEEDLRQAQRLEALGLLAGGVAHDFNNLLTPILAYAELSLAEFGGRDADLDDGLREIVAAAERARDLTRQLLAFGRKQTLVVRSVDLNAEVLAVRKMLARVLPENIEMVLSLADGLPQVKVDASQLQQVLMNLAVNARDAMPGGGRLTFTTQQIPSIGAGSVVLSVSDTGVGMSDEVRSQIFQPFYTTKEVGKGTGLGLATVHGIVEQLEGSIDVTSAPGCGATFTIRLPSAVDADRATAIPRAPAMRPRAKATVLVVEDEPFVRRLVCEVLRRRGLDVLSAAGPDEAMSLASGHEGGIDLLLTDVIMPRMNGHQLFLRLATERAHLQVLYMSGYARDALGANGVVDEDLPLLQKPFSPTALLAAIDEVLAASFVRVAL